MSFWQLNINVVTSEAPAVEVGGHYRYDGSSPFW